MKLVRALLSALPTFFCGRGPSVSITLQRRSLPHLCPSGRAAISNLPPCPAPGAAAPGSSPQTLAVAPPQGPVTTTASSCTIETVGGRHVFKVAGYSLLKGLGVGKFVRSATFAVGGYDWCVRYCPDGDGREEGRGDHCAAVFLALMTKDVEVRALFDLRLVNPATGRLSPSMGSGMERPTVFNDAVWSCGHQMLDTKRLLEASKYLQGDCLVIQCDVTVIMGTPVSQSQTMCDIFQAKPCDIQGSPSGIAAPPCEIHVPPSEHLDNLWNLFMEVKEADLTITVRGEVFHAHRSILAMRSPVFIESDIGDIDEYDIGPWNPNCIGIDHMHPDVFKALLHFIYTDSLLPGTDDIEADDGKRKTVEGLLEAADTYALDRLKLICESILCKKLSVNNVAATLDLANWHHCRQLKDACIGFITSSGRIYDVVASQGYKKLKEACPALVAEIWEKAAN